MHEEPHHPKNLCWCNFTSPHFVLHCPMSYVVGNLFLCSGQPLHICTRVSKNDHLALGPPVVCWARQHCTARLHVRVKMALRRASFILLPPPHHHGHRTGCRASRLGSGGGDTAAAEQRCRHLRRPKARPSAPSLGTCMSRAKRVGASSDGSEQLSGANAKYT